MRITRVSLKQAFAPITIMVIPHEDLRSVNVRIPAVGLLCLLLFSAAGGLCISFLAVSGWRHAAQQRLMSEKLTFYSEQFNQWNSTATALKKVEGEFRRLFPFGSEDRAVKDEGAPFVGSADIPSLVEHLKSTAEMASTINDYLRIKKDLYLSTPRGAPVAGNITSGYGKREGPFSGESEFHSGVDISSVAGSPVRATADAVVSHSGWTPNSGYTIVLQHGFGYSTIYAHNRRNLVKTGQTVKAGDVIGYVGSTGKSTGPHVHYEVWKDGKHVNPLQYLNGRS